MALIINSKKVDEGICTCEGSSSWLDHWEIHTGTSPLYCRACITKTGLIGKHVLKPESEQEFIVPLCGTCSQKEGEMDIWSYEELASVHCIKPVKVKLKTRKKTKS